MAGLSLDLFSIICRTCLMQRKLFPIEQVQMEEGTLLDLLQNVIFTEGHIDGLPPNMCDDCIQESAVVYKFLVKCKSSYQILKQMIKSCKGDHSTEVSKSNSSEKTSEERSNEKVPLKDVLHIKQEHVTQVEPQEKSVEENLEKMFSEEDKNTHVNSSINHHSHHPEVQDKNVQTNQEKSVSVQKSKLPPSNVASKSSLGSSNIVENATSSVSKTSKVTKEKIQEVTHTTGQIVHANQDPSPRNIRPKRNKIQLNVNNNKEAIAEEPPTKKRVLSMEGQYQEIRDPIEKAATQEKQEIVMEEHVIEDNLMDDVEVESAYVDTNEQITIIEEVQEESEQMIQNEDGEVDCKIETIVEQDSEEEIVEEQLCENEYMEATVCDGEDLEEDETEQEEQQGGDEDYVYETEDYIEEGYEKEENSEEEDVKMDSKYLLQCPEDDEVIEENIRILDKAEPKEMRQHKMNYSKEMKPIQEIDNMCYCCSDCDAPFFSYEELIHHKTTEKHRAPQIFVCPECNNRYRRFILFWEHLQGHMGERSYGCEWCNKHFVHKRELQNHINEVHLRTKEFGCDDCGKVFTRKSNLTTHQRIHSGTYRSVCPYCGESVTPTTLWAHKKRHQKEQENGGPAYQCHICEKIVTTEEILKDHVARIHEPKNLECDICHKKCSNEKILKEHKDFVHKDGRFECRICGNVYKQKGILKDHIRNYHSGEAAERYRCGLCQREFNYKSSLREHMRTHTGDTKFQCQYCKKICLNSRLYKLHMATHGKKGSA